MRHGLINHGGWLFDRLEEGWESAAGRRRSAFFLVIFFVGSVLLIEGNRQGWLPAQLAAVVPSNHLVAIEWAFTLLLILEVVGLTLALSKSVSISVGKQLEILSLILLRNTFKEISHLDEPLLWEQVEPVLVPMVSSALGALMIFVVLGFYYRVHSTYPSGGDRIVDKTRFILTKKNIALLLLAGFVVIVLHDIGEYFLHGNPESIFEKFYTLLVFSDVLLVLISLRYSRGYLVAFRNSGFAVVTVLLRLALIAPPMIGAMLGGGTALFALAIIYAYTVFSAGPPGLEQPRIKGP
ncbi:hypothetical protein [Desulfurivibrio alkaliphilus]|uniref:Uncharacterized protein n=1 Tax=Desulfurivibrio alkaliphilus (strain DSM 19089 / UNIQEM U267 / AHT2) TaxID=589865 RepID=D6Z549_DESAT|nr:hypothetical protein [Desulfurivibrio alkaliphilus]ADH86674.1 conserved hypothetical protein [Desulfurivibrio alkaliphilus AHT 2]